MDDELLKKIVDNIRDAIEDYTGEKCGITDVKESESHEYKTQEGKLEIEYWYKDSIFREMREEDDNHGDKEDN